jgi:hypothetical protein
MYVYKYLTPNYTEEVDDYPIRKKTLVNLYYPLLLENKLNSIIKSWLRAQIRFLPAEPGL